MPDELHASSLSPVLVRILPRLWLAEARSIGSGERLRASLLSAGCNEHELRAVM